MHVGVTHLGEELHVLGDLASVGGGGLAELEVDNGEVVGGQHDAVWALEDGVTLVVVGEDGALVEKFVATGKPIGGLGLLQGFPGVNQGLLDFVEGQEAFVHQVVDGGFDVVGGVDGGEEVVVAFAPVNELVVVAFFAPPLAEGFGAGGLPEVDFLAVADKGHGDVAAFGEEGRAGL